MTTQRFNAEQFVRVAGDAIIAADTGTRGVKSPLGSFLTVRRSTRTERPAGDHDFKRRIERLTRRVLQRKKPGLKKQKN